MLLMSTMSTRGAGARKRRAATRRASARVARVKKKSVARLAPRWRARKIAIATAVVAGLAVLLYLFKRRR